MVVRFFNGMLQVEREAYMKTYKDAYMPVHHAVLANDILSPRSQAMSNQRDVSSFYQDIELCRLLRIGLDVESSMELNKHTAAAATIGTGSRSLTARRSCSGFSAPMTSNLRSSLLRYAEPGCLSPTDIIALIRVTTLPV